MSAIARNTTYSRLRFHTFEHGVIETIDDSSKPLKSGIFGWDYTKPLSGSAAGQFSVKLRRDSPDGDPWSELLDEGDWWELDVIKNGIEHGVAFGQVSSVTTEMSAGGRGEGRVRVTVHGQDAARPLDIQPVFFNPYDVFMDNAAGLQMLQILGSLAGPPSTMLVNMLRGLMGARGIFGGFVEVPTSLKRPVLGTHQWLSLLDTVKFVEPNLRGVLGVGASELLVPENSSSVWSYLQSWSNPMLNEMYCDCSTRVGQKQLYFKLREKPFENAIDGSSSPWFAMEPWSLDNLQSLNLSKGRNRVNYVQVHGDLFPGLTQDVMALMFPLADKDSVKRYGLRKLSEQTRYFDDPGLSGSRAEFERWLTLTAGWNALNHRYWSGVASLGELRPEIRVGQRAMLTKTLPGSGFPVGMDFYVEAVQHSYTAGAEPVQTTSLQLSRGYPESDRIRDMIKAVNGFSESTSTARRVAVDSVNKLRSYELTKSEVSEVEEARMSGMTNAHLTHLGGG